MNDPLAQIEDAHGQQSIGALLLHVYRGAHAENGSRVDALWVTAAVFVGLMQNANPDEQP